MHTALFGPNIARVEIDGTPYTPSDAIPVIESLDDVKRDAVVIVFADGVRTSYSKLVESQGDNGVRIAGSKGFI